MGRRRSSHSVFFHSGSSLVQAKGVREGSEDGTFEMSYEVGINWVESGVRVLPAASVKALRCEEARFISVPCGWNTDSGRESGAGCRQKVGTAPGMV